MICLTTGQVWGLIIIAIFLLFYAVVVSIKDVNDGYRDNTIKEDFD